MPENFLEPTLSGQKRTMSNGETNQISGKERIKKILLERANKKTGFVSMSPRELGEIAGIDEHETIHLIKASLAKQDFVTYKEYRNKRIGRIRLTPTALGKQDNSGNRNRRLRKFGSVEEDKSIREVVEEAQHKTDFPIIRRLMKKREKLLAAAEMVKEVSPELSELIAGEAPFTDLEKEAIALYQEHFREEE